MSTTTEKTIASITPALLPIGKGAGRPARTVLLVTYTDGTTEHRCLDCGYTAETFMSVFSHRGKVHGVRKTAKAKAKTPASVALPDAVADAFRAAVAEAVELATADMQAQADAWKARARTAEASLGSIQRAFRKVTA